MILYTRCHLHLLYLYNNVVPSNTTSKESLSFLQFGLSLNISFVWSDWVYEKNIKS